MKNNNKNTLKKPEYKKFVYDSWSLILWDTIADLVDLFVYLHDKIWVKSKPWAWNISQKILKIFTPLMLLFGLTLYIGFFLYVLYDFYHINLTSSFFNPWIVFTNICTIKCEKIPGRFFIWLIAPLTGLLIIIFVAHLKKKTIYKMSSSEFIGLIFCTVLVMVGIFVQLYLIYNFVRFGVWMYASKWVDNTICLQLFGLEHKMVIHIKPGDWIYKRRVYHLIWNSLEYNNILYNFTNGCLLPQESFEIKGYICVTLQEMLGVSDSCLWDCINTNGVQYTLEHLADFIGPKVEAKIQSDEHAKFMAELNKWFEEFKAFKASQPIKYDKPPSWEFWVNLIKKYWGK